MLKENKIMTKKEMVNKVLEEKNAKVNNEGVYEVTEKGMEAIKASIVCKYGNSLTVCKSRKQENMFAIYDISRKTRFAIITVVEPKKKTKKENQKTTKTASSYIAYLVEYKLKGSDEKIVDDSISGCASIKALIKKVGKKNFESLHIYKIIQEGNKKKKVETRKSAWVA